MFISVCHVSVWKTIPAMCHAPSKGSKCFRRLCRGGVLTNMAYIGRFICAMLSGPGIDDIANLAIEHHRANSVNQAIPVWQTLCWDCQIVVHETHNWQRKVQWDLLATKGHLVDVAIVHSTRDTVLLHRDDAVEAVIGCPNLGSMWSQVKSLSFSLLRLFFL